MSKTAINRQQEGLAIANIIVTVKRISETKYVVKQHGLQTLQIIRMFHRE
jgi:hypothetical protein